MNIKPIIFCRDKRILAQQLPQCKSLLISLRNIMIIQLLVDPIHGQQSLVHIEFSCCKTWCDYFDRFLNLT